MHDMMEPRGHVTNACISADSLVRPLRSAAETTCDRLDFPGASRHIASINTIYAQGLQSTRLFGSIRFFPDRFDLCAVNRIDISDALSIDSIVRIASIFPDRFDLCAIHRIDISDRFDSCAINRLDC